MFERTLSLLTSLFASLGGWFLVGIGTIVLSLFGLFMLWPFSFLFQQGNGQLLHAVSQFWARAISRLLPFWEIRVEGLERIQKGGTREAIPKHAWRIKERALLRLKILPPVSAKDSSLDRLEDLRQEIRTKIVKEFESLLP